MNFMSTSSSSSSSSFHYLTTTSTAAPPHNHHHHHIVRTAAPPSDDAGEDNSPATATMSLFARSEDIITSNSNDEIPAALMEKEHMFDKVVTPSDVGKLNRLVIPKQYAEKYFPLDSSTNEKGLLLNFEDRSGKPWRFRYSYWNSSQSYVMTKGWSRFVKEKKLDAGDIVSFQRGSGELGKDRLFIDWRRRPDAPDLMTPPPHHHHHQFSYHRSFNPMFLQPRHHDYASTAAPFSPPPHYGYNGTTIVDGNPCPPGSILYLRSAGAGNSNHGGFYGGPHYHQHMGSSTLQQFQRSGGGGALPSNDQLLQHQQMVFDSVPIVQGKAAAKRLRLFGVNMDCPISDDDDHVLSSTAHPTMPVFRNFAGFDSNSLLPSSSSTVPSSHYRSYEDEEDEEDRGKGNSMSLDLDI